MLPYLPSTLICSISKLTREDAAFLEEIYDKLGTYVQYFEKQRLREALKTVLEISSSSNRFTQENKIWENTHSQPVLLNKLAILTNMIRLIALV